MSIGRTPSTTLCVDCGVDTTPGWTAEHTQQEAAGVATFTFEEIATGPWEQYAFRFAVWEEAGAPDGAFALGALRSG